MLPDEPERVGVLVIRVWLEPAGCRLVAKISGRTDVLAEEETSVMAIGSAAASRTAHEWLVAFEDRGGSG